MTDIYIPVGPAELVDQIVLAEPASNEAAVLASRGGKAERLTQMKSIAAAALPADTVVSSASIVSARHDLIQLEADLRACEARSDFGISFVALARAYLDALDTLGRHKAEYDATALAQIR